MARREAGRFLGLLDREDGHVTTYRRTPGGASIAEEQTLDAVRAAEELDADYTEAVEGAQLLEPVDLATFRSGETTPMLFGAALANIGVRQLLDAVVDLAPAPGDRPAADSTRRPVDAPFSGFVFKMQAGMDPKHRDHVAYVRVCSGRFERGMIVTHERTGRPFATKYALSVFGRERSTVEHAYPGDVVGLVNANALAVGDTVHEPDGPSVRFPPMPAFEPEHFAVARASDPGRSKQFRKGMSQLEQEGVVQVLVSDLRGDASPILAAVGPLQFEVASFRMEHEFSAPMTLEQLPLSVARLLDPEHAATLAAYPGAEVARRRDGECLALLRDVWHARAFERGHPKIALTPLIASES